MFSDTYVFDYSKEINKRKMKGRLQMKATSTSLAYQDLIVPVRKTWLIFYYMTEVHLWIYGGSRSLT